MNSTGCKVTAIFAPDFIGLVGDTPKRWIFYKNYHFPTVAWF